MKIALLGYGKMGKEIEKIAVSRHHEIVLKIDVFNLQDLTPENLQKAEVAIDFSTPESAFSNIMLCFNAGVPVICGTTGWLDKFDEVTAACNRKNGTFFYASNYSLGVNLFFAVNRYLASLMKPHANYDVSIKEVHHVHKLDAPSGTAISLAKDIIANMGRKSKWELNAAPAADILGITSEREGEVPGTHVVTWDSDVDSIAITHAAKNRKGLALGAISAAEFIRGKKGVFGMKDLLGF